MSDDTDVERYFTRLLLHVSEVSSPFRENRVVTLPPLPASRLGTRRYTYVHLNVLVTRGGSARPHIFVIWSDHLIK